MTTTVRSRPFGVSFLSILIIITGIAEIIGGIVLLAVHDDDLRTSLDVSQGTINAIAIIAIIVGVIDLLIAAGLRSGANWARLLVGIVAALRVVGVIWAATGGHELHWYQAILPALIYILVAWYLFGDEDVKGFFGAARR